MYPLKKQKMYKVRFCFYF